MFKGRNSKEPFQYSMEYYALKNEVREVLYFQDLCTLEIHKLFGDPYYGENIRKIAHMVDEVCKKVETGWLPPGAKRGVRKEDSSKPFSFPRIRRMFVFSSKRVSKSYELRTTQDEEASSSLKEEEENPCADEDPIIKNLVVGSVENECTSDLFVGDLHITDRDVGSSMGGETPCIRSKRTFQIIIIVTFGAT